MKSIETINTTPSTQNQHQNSENYWDILDSFASVSAILSEASSVTAKISYQLSKDNESIQQSSAKAFAKKINADESVLNTTQTVMDIVQVVMIGLMISNVATALAGVAVEGSLVQFAKTALPMAANILIPLATGALFANNPSIVGTILKGIIPLGIMGGLHLYQKSLKMGTDEAQAVVGSRIQQGLSATILLFSALEIVEGVMQVQISNATKDFQISKAASDRDQSEVDLLGKKVVGFQGANATIAGGVNDSIIALGNSAQYIENKLSSSIKQQN